MSRINRLPDSVANKISAGEVVQRPASVVKELLENALDAGATSISVSVKNAGRDLIRIIDNGMGMDEDDALSCIERFATSKISSAEELDAIETLGFRGEALASISSVSHFELKTRRENDGIGIQLVCEGGKPGRLSKTACETGTQVNVRNLFYNVPARRKFLKTNATEYRHIYEIVKAQALAYPEIRWRMLNDEEELFDFRSTDIHERLDFFFGEGFSERLIEVHEENDFLSIHGFIGKPALQKRQKNEQFIYVNRRLIQNRMLSQALQQAYGELLVERQTPFSLLFLGIDPCHVDVNVHPAKLEVRFEDERNVRSMFYSVIKKALHSRDFSPSVGAFGSQGETPYSSAPSSTAGSARLGYREDSAGMSTTSDLYRNYREGISDEGVTTGSPAGLQEESPGLEQSFGDEPRRELRRSDFSLEAQKSDGNMFREEQVSDPKIWQLHNKYMICQIKTGLMVIDQHVAHERILYERAVDVMNHNIPNAQQLLFPQKVDLKPWEYEIYEEIQDDLERLGFAVSALGGSTVMIEGVPQDVLSGSESYILQDMIDEYRQNAEKLKLEKRENLAKSYSCRNAIMTGQQLTLEDMRSLIDRLFATKMPYVCPHGRPVIIRISLDELDRMFGRK